MAEPVCAGCGKRLPRPSGRGRPATYHGPACRQRARRARLAADPVATDLLALLDQAGRAIATARRAVTSGDDPQSALAELAAATDLVSVRHAAEVATTPSAEVEHPSLTAAQPAAVTNSVTNPAAPTARPVTREDVIDVDAVRVERSEDFEISGTYRVLAGDSVLLGYLARDQRRRWEARTAATALTVPGGPWRTRQDALVGLLLNGSIRTTKMRSPLR
ncbi:hypothetical protein [Amycolatopsis pretoriensis]|uniref:hypothetical protein n=1 Tax=Amycolatopsis pretoriensis TaxID=218821 RepID=UPI001ABF3D45|nr:hypothetical protein [Amycolatopsis pretoriensis]